TRSRRTARREGVYGVLVGRAPANSHSTSRPRTSLLTERVGEVACDTGTTSSHEPRQGRPLTWRTAATNPLLRTAATTPVPGPGTVPQSGEARPARPTMK